MHVQRTPFWNYVADKVPQSQSKLRKCHTKFWVQAHTPHTTTAAQYLSLRHKQQRIFQRAQTIWIIIMCVLKLRTMSCQTINVISCICYALHSNDSHNTQPSENYYNYLSFPFFAAKFPSLATAIRFFVCERKASENCTFYLVFLL